MAQQVSFWLKLIQIFFILSTFTNVPVLKPYHMDTLWTVFHDVSVFWVWFVVLTLQFISKLVFDHLVTRVWQMKKSKYLLAYEYMVPLITKRQQIFIKGTIATMLTQLSQHFTIFDHFDQLLTFMTIKIWKYTPLKLYWGMQSKCTEIYYIIHGFTLQNY